MPRAVEDPIGVYIWVRQTLDWNDEEAALAQIVPDTREKALLWNATLTMSYPRFRHRVREIARRSLAAVDGATVVDDWEAIPDGALVLPVDDDDWFAPDAARVLQAAQGSGATAFYWPPRWIEVPTNWGHAYFNLRRWTMPSTPPTYLCSTNNYAMVKREDVRDELLRHRRATVWFEERLTGPDPGAVREVAGALSITNRTLASRTTLQMHLDTIPRASLVRRLRLHRWIYHRRLPAAYSWARPYARAMAELMAEVKVRRQIVG